MAKPNNRGRPPAGLRAVQKTLLPLPSLLSLKTKTAGVRSALLKNGEPNHAPAPLTVACNQIMYGRRRYKRYGGNRRYFRKYRGRGDYSSVI